MLFSISDMKTSARLCIEKQLIRRQYHEKWKFTDCNEIIKKLQCNHVLSFNNCPIPGDLQDNNDVPVSTCKFSNKHKDILAVANENGIVCIENIKKVQAIKFVQTHKNTVYDIAWMPGSTQFVTVSGDNSAKLWDCQESCINLISTFMGHRRSVRCVSFKPENTAVFATGSRDGSLMIWDARAQKKCAKFSHHLPDQIIASGAGSQCTTTKKSSLSLELLNSRSVTGLVFQNDNTLISCGSVDKFIRVWDMRKTYSRSATNTVAKYQFESPNVGFSYLCMNAFGTKLYANCMDSYIYCFNLNSYNPDPVAAFCGHRNGSFYVKSSVSFDGLYLMSGSSDETAYIWNTRNAGLSQDAVKPFVVLSSHTAEVTCVEMSPDNMVVVTCSDDGTFRLWDPYINSEFKQIVSKNYIGKTSQKLQLDNSLRISSKRKLDGISGSIEGGHKSKRINSERLLTTLNLIEKRQDESTGLKISEESHKKALNNSVKEFLKKTSADINIENMSCVVPLSSPTSNLPNYVEDGTSPYIHKCPRVLQKEKDWLTKLRQTYKPTKILEPKPLSTNVTTPQSEKRKAKIVDYTLHKYFKVSSKGMEKSFNVQEIKKRNILAKVEN